MKPAERSEDRGEAPGLPALRTWRQVYGVVAVSFVLWVVGLVVLAGLFP
jgi:hypothetical protein